MDNKLLSQIFKSIKIDFEMTYEKIAEDLGYDNGYLSKLLNNKMTITTKFARKLADYLEDLLRGRDKVEGQQYDNYLAAIRLFVANESTRLRQEKAFGSKKPKGTIAVPIKAQANYSRNIQNPTFIHQLERFFFPNNPYDGDNYRFFQMEGTSMEYLDENNRPSGLPDGSWIIAENVPKEDWSHNLRQYYVHVIVTDNMVTIKRILQDNSTEIVLHADNEEEYGQMRLPLSEVREIWLFKRRLDWNAPPPRTLEIKV